MPEESIISERNSIHGANHVAGQNNNVIVASGDMADEVTLLDILDHVLNAGIVIRGSLIISLAGVDLIYLGLDVILSSVETALRYLQRDASAASLPKAAVSSSPKDL